MSQQVLEQDPRAGEQICTPAPSALTLSIQTNENPEAGACQPTLRVVHIWTAEPTWRVFVNWDSGYENAVCHRGDCAAQEIREIASLSSLRQFLQEQIDCGTPIDYLDFHTHGAPGGIAFEKDYLSIFDLGGLEKYADAFNPGAFIEFHGCNVAEGFVGESFLYEIGARLLNKGGKVGASTGVGLAISFVNIGGKCMPHPFGDWVTWEVTPESDTLLMTGDKVTLSVEEAFDSAVQRYESADRELARRCSPGPCVFEDEIRKELRTVRLVLEDSIEDPGSGEPVSDPNEYTGERNRLNLALAFLSLDEAESMLFREAQLSDSVAVW